MLELKQINTCHCPECGDTFEVTREMTGVSEEYSITPFYDSQQVDKDMRSSIEWWTTDKVCYRCGKTYRPFRNGRRMDEFVFDAIRSVKGG